MDLTREDSGGTRSVRVGDQITVTLPERPTTGYRWRVDTDPAVLRQTADRYEGATRPMGAAGTRILTFEVLAAAPAVLRLVEVRSWESTVSDEFVIHLEPG